jgi:predicted ester cyclase
VGGGPEVPPGLARLGLAASGVLAAGLDILRTANQARASRSSQCRSRRDLDTARKEPVMADDLKAIARRTLEEIIPNGDVAGLRAVMHPEVVNHEPPAGAPPGLDGMIQAMRWVQGGFSERRFEIHQVIADGDTVVVHCTFHGRHTGQFMGLAPTNQPVAFRQVHIVRFQDSKAVEHWAVRDDLGLGRQLGVFPGPRGRAVPGGP